MTVHSPTRIVIPFDNSYARLPARFFARLSPTAVAAPRLLKLNDALARELGLDPAVLSTPEGVAILAGNQLAEGSAPIAQAYAGHQFGGFSPQLGDGRAILLGEIVDPAGRRHDIQLKGSGPTPFSRRGDGRAAIGPVLREYIISEAMHALAIPTTRSLAAVATGEPVYRETALPGAVLTRIASSHIRVGTFQYFAARQDADALRILVDHVVERHDPDIGPGPQRARDLLDRVVARQASLIARWMQVGFIHGVMNTDNCAISGETIDYGPCAFMDTFHPSTVYSSIDETGRYAYVNQPRIGLWNLTRLAEALLPLLDDDQERAVGIATEVLETYSGRFESAWLTGLRAKLGLSETHDGDVALAGELLEIMAAARADFTMTFRRLADAAEGTSGEGELLSLFDAPAAIESWLTKWRGRLTLEPVTANARATAMRRANPLYIPRNHLVEEALAAATKGDLGPFEALISVLARPFDEQPGRERYAQPPRPEEVVARTFCGT